MLLSTDSRTYSLFIIDDSVYSFTRRRDLTMLLNNDTLCYLYGANSNLVIIAVIKVFVKYYYLTVDIYL